MERPTHRSKVEVRVRAGHPRELGVEAQGLAGFHFRNSDQQGSSLGRKVARNVADHFFQPLG